MRYLRKIKLEASGKSINIDTSKITVPEYRIAIDTNTDVNKSDAIVAKSCNLSLKELQALPFPDYQQLLAHWWKVVLTPMEDEKRVELDEKDLEKYGVKYGQTVVISKPGEKESPNSQSASTSD